MEISIPFLQWIIIINHLYDKWSLYSTPWHGNFHSFLSFLLEGFPWWRRCRPRPCRTSWRSPWNSPARRQRYWLSTCPLQYFLWAFLFNFIVNRKTDRLYYSLVKNVICVNNNMGVLIRPATLQYISRSYLGPFEQNMFYSWCIFDKRYSAIITLVWVFSI